SGDTPAPRPYGAICEGAQRRHRATQQPISREDTDRLSWDLLLDEPFAEPLLWRSRLMALWTIRSTPTVCAGPAASRKAQVSNVRLCRRNPTKTPGARQPLKHSVESSGNPPE